MAELLDNSESKNDGPTLPSEAEMRIIEGERKKIEDELVALEKAELADKILSEEGARREKAMIFNKEELAAMGKMGLSLLGLAGLDRAPSSDGTRTPERDADDQLTGEPTDLTMDAASILKNIDRDSLDNAPLAVVNDAAR